MFAMKDHKSEGEQLVYFCPNEEELQLLKDYHRRATETYKVELQKKIDYEKAEGHNFNKLPPLNRQHFFVHHPSKVQGMVERPYSGRVTEEVGKWSNVRM